MKTKATASWTLACSAIRAGDDVLVLGLASITGLGHLLLGGHAATHCRLAEVAAAEAAPPHPRAQTMHSGRRVGAARGKGHGGNSQAEQLARDWTMSAGRSCVF